MPANIDTVAVKNLVSRLNVGTLVLPNFQRDFVWDTDDWQSLIASLMMDYPVGMLLIGSNGHSNAYQMKNPLSIPSEELIGVYKSRLEEADVDIPDGEYTPEQLLAETDDGFGCDFLLDGQQRVSAIDLVFGEAFAKCTGKELSHTRRRRWFLNLTDLGLADLQWIELNDLSHSDVSEMIIKVPYRLTDEEDQDYYYGKDDTELIHDFCLNNDIDSARGKDSILLPFDRVYNINRSVFGGDPNEISDCFEFNFSFVDTLLQVHEGFIYQQIARGENRISDGRVEDGFKKELEGRLREWRDHLRDLLKGIPDITIPVVEVPANDFKRIAGIFSVVNKTGVDLHVFDLLVAKTAERGRTIRNAFTNAVQKFSNDFEDQVSSLLHTRVLEGLSTQEQQNYWKLSSFLNEKSSVADDVDAGERFPEKNRKLYAQVITLMAKIGHAVETDENIEIGGQWYETDFHEVRNGADKNLAQFVEGVISLGGDWKFGDDEIIDTSREQVWKYAEQAALQLLRAMFFCGARLGTDRYAALPYKQMLLVLACSLTDPVWESITGEHGRNHWRSKKLEKWYWGSIFGGAYQRRQDARVCDDIPRVIAYLSDSGVTWSDVANASYEEEGIHYEESGTRGTEQARFNAVFGVRGYSDQDALMQSANTSLEKAICSFELSDGMSDFASPEGEYGLLHAGLENVDRNSRLERDHIVALGAWNARLENGAVDRVERNSQHTINSPLNKTYISREANSYWSDRNAFLKFDLFNDDDDRPNELFSDHSLSSSTLRSHFEDHVDLIRGGTATNDELTSNLLHPLLEVRFEELERAVRSLCSEVS